MSAYKRVQHWATFARTWHIYDAKWQNPFESGKVIAKYLKGLHKPIYSPITHCGDHVVVINCKHIALPGSEWKDRVYFHHTGYPGSATWTVAWKVHKSEPLFIIEKAILRAMKNNIQRRHTMQRLHLFEEENVPEHILQNVSSQIKQLRPVPRTLSSFSEKELLEFPKVEDFTQDYAEEKFAVTPTNISGKELQ